MSLSKEMAQFTDEDLITCGICHIEIKEPKSLACLHTYCLDCLREWSKQRKDVVICPLCRESTPLPATGVDGLRSNFFVTKLKDRKALSRQLMDKNVKIVCTSCDVSDGNAAVSRCLECDDFLCQYCVKAHMAFRLTKHHIVFTLTELRSGKIDLSKISKKEPCKKHTSQVLWFFCTTCGVPLCRDCTVVEHPAGSHELVELNAAVRGQREEIKKLVIGCSVAKQEVDGALVKAHGIRKDLDATCDRASASVDVTKDKVEKLLAKQSGDFKKRITELKSAKEKILAGHKDELQMLQSRLNTALEMATQLTNEGSDCDVASVYTTLQTTMKQLEHVSTPFIDLEYITFVEDSSLITSLGSIGKVEDGKIKHGSQSKSNQRWNKEQWNARWKMIKKFGDAGDGILKDAMGVAINQDGDVAVTDYNVARAYVYDIDDGNLKLTIDTNQSLHSNPSHYISIPHGIAVSHDGNYIISDTTYFPTIYDSKGKYIRQIPISKYKDNLTKGISINAQSQILVGHNNTNSLSIHNYSDGAFQSHLDISILAMYISISADGKIIAIADGRKSAQVIDSNGHSIHVLRPPTDVTAQWNPSGVCTIGEGEEEEVFICNREWTKGVYRFSLITGKYLGCVTTELSDPRGIAFTENKMLVVADKTCVKLFAPTD